MPEKPNILLVRRHIGYFLHQQNARATLHRGIMMLEMEPTKIKNLKSIRPKRRDLPYRSGRCKLGEGQEPGQPGRAAYRRRDVVKRMSAIGEFILFPGAGYDPKRR